MPADISSAGPISQVMGALVFGAFLITWVVALLDCLARDFDLPDDKWKWLLALVLTTGVGAVIYLFLGRAHGELPKYAPPAEDPPIVPSSKPFP